jgi:hypothetical protein
MKRRWLAASLGFVWACNAGPISDFPFAGDNEGNSPSVNPPGADSGGDAGVRPADGGSWGPSLPSYDAGAPVGEFPDAGFPFDGGGVFVPPSDAGLPDADADVDADVDADADAGSPWDAGTWWWPEPVPPSADAGVGCPASGSPNACGGAYCGLDLPELVSVSVLGRACTSDTSSLVAVCSGSLPAVTAACAQSLVASGQAVSELSIRQCVAGLSGSRAESACLGCFAAEMECALRSCSAAFLTGDGSAAATCRAERCAAPFAACSGLPAVWMD